MALGKDLLNNSSQKIKTNKNIILCLKTEVIVSYTELQMLGLDGAETKNQREQREGNMLSVCSMVTNPRNMAELTKMNWKCGKLIRTNRKPSNNSVVYTFND